jgi:alpha-beta hydrolase superfamily lysophospholipase
VRILLVLLPSALLLPASTGCSTMSRDETPPEIVRMQRELPPLEAVIDVVLEDEGSARGISHVSGVAARYRAEVGGLPTGTVYTPGRIFSREIPIAVHLFRPPEEPRGTVLVLHGYLSYPAEMGSVIRMLLSEGYVVVAPALPGHGLSGGDRAAIDEFADYGQLVEDLLDLLGDVLPHPWHAIGHSTGATALYEYFRSNARAVKPVDAGSSPGASSDPFEAVVFLAPLIRSAWYRASRLGRFLARPFVSHVSTGSDNPFIPGTMPLEWFDAQVRWNRDLGNNASVTRPVLVIQGDADTVVHWRYNRRFLLRSMACVRYELLPGAGHVLHGRDEEVRRHTLRLVRQYIQDYSREAPCACSR